VCSSDLNPTEAYVFRTVEGAAPEQVTGPGPAFESASRSPSGALVVTRLTPTSMAKTTVLLPGGRAVSVPSVAVEPSLTMTTERFKLTNSPGSHVSVTRPKDFVKGRKYPVILSVYGGPRHQVVLASMDLNAQWLANQGFIVVRADGRGTPGRGREWERAISHDFATLIAADQVAALKGVAERVPELDLTRVGVFGWSFGGYLSALLGMSRPDVFKSAIAGAPVVDWRDYDTHYTERYLGLLGEQPRAYEVSSLLTYVDKAARPLLLMHGTADDNVYFLHTLKLSDALFKAGKPHAVLPLANFTHMVPDPLATQREWERIASWFKETL
jgi:dipeptidyl-peptidase-4